MANARRGRGRLIGIVATGLLAAGATAFVAWYNVRLDLPAESPEAAATGNAIAISDPAGEAGDTSAGMTAPEVNEAAPVIDAQAPEALDAPSAVLPGSVDIAASTPTERTSPQGSRAEAPEPEGSPTPPELPEAAGVPVQENIEVSNAPAGGEEGSGEMEAPEATELALMAEEPAEAAPSVAAQTKDEPEVGLATETDEITSETTLNAPERTANPDAATADPDTPAFDEVRREEDGLTIIAGRAVPGARIEVLQDGTSIATATADGSGKFAAIALVPTDGTGHILSLTQTAQGKTLRSESDVILAPLAAMSAEEGSAAQVVSPREDPTVAASSGVAAGDADPGIAVVAANEGAREGIEQAGISGSDPSRNTSDIARTADETVEENEAPDTNTVSQAEVSVATADIADASEKTKTRKNDPATGAPASETLIRSGTEAEAVTTPEANDTAGIGPASETPRASAAQSESQTPTSAEPSTRAEARSAATVPSNEPLNAQNPPADPPNETAALSGDVKDTPAAAAVPSPQTAAPVPEPAQSSDNPTITATQVPDALPPQPDPVEIAPRKPPSRAILRADRNGVEVMSPATPQVMSNVALDTISYSETGDVQLAGRAQSDATQIRVYLDNDAVIDLAVDAEGRWRGDLPNVDEGIYTLRVDEMDAAGAVTSRVETPFKRESAETLAAASRDGDGPVTVVTVQKGDTLWAISRERYGDGLLYVRVFEANSEDIRDPDLIYPGQVFDLPR